MMRTIVLGVAVVLALVAAGFPKSSSITLPATSIMFKPGPNLGIVQANCLVCHNSDYVYFQPALTRAQWTAEVTKMRGVYKATIADGDIPKIVDYLMSQNGKT